MTHHLYNVKPRADEDWTLCPLCDSKLKSCHIGEYCGDEKCGYVDGIVFLTDEEYELIKDKLE